MRQGIDVSDLPESQNECFMTAFTISVPSSVRGLDGFELL
jgi:hypothetical protein